MDIVGGAYLEEVDFYDYRNVFGSAVRATAAVSNLADGEAHLTVRAAERHIATLNGHARAHGFSLNVQESTNQIIGFRYYHGLTDGNLFGWAGGDTRYRLEVTDSAAVLRFGMVEGTAVVSGDRVVYDPQSPQPEPFHQNGSEATHLALVLNASEAKAWSKKHDLEPAGEELLDLPDVEAVVIKCGPKGALAFSGDGIGGIPSYRTSHVWPVGSGDVFSGVFAYYWAVEEKSPVQAARAASAAAAYFCDTQVLPIPHNPPSHPEFTGDELPLRFGEPTPQIYLAGPFFTLGQRWLVNEARRGLLELDVDVFSPLHDVGDVTERESVEDVAASDLDGLQSSDLVLALLDEPDSGTNVEIGYARSRDIPVVIYADHLQDRQRTMLEGTDCQIFDHFPTAVYQSVWRAQT